MCKPEAGSGPLDINMSEMDGLQALDEICKVSPKTMVSAESTMDKVKEAIKKGAVGFVVKPLNATSILDRIENFSGKGNSHGR